MSNPIYLRGTREVLSRVEPGREHSVGSDMQCDIVVLHRTIEQHHATVLVDGDALRVRPVKGATSVDGTRVLHEAIARPKSMILIGEVELRVQSSDGNLLDREYERVVAKRRHRDAETGGRSMRGELEEIPVPDLLALLDVSKKNGVLVASRGDDVARVHHARGIIQHVVIGTRESTGDDDARALVFELLGWTEGKFELESPDAYAPRTASLHGTELILEYRRVPR